MALVLAQGSRVLAGAARVRMNGHCYHVTSYSIGKRYYRYPLLYKNPLQRRGITFLLCEVPGSPLPTSPSFSYALCSDNGYHHWKPLFACLFLHLLQSQNLKATFPYEMTFVSQIGTSNTAYPVVQLILAILWKLSYGSQPQELWDVSVCLDSERKGCRK